MARRYRKKHNNLASIVADVAHVASQLPWWGSLLIGVIAYLLMAHALCGYFENLIADQANSTFSALIETRLGRLVNLCNWVGIACFFAGLFFAVRNYLITRKAQSTEKSIVTTLSKIIGRSVD